MTQQSGVGGQWKAKRQKPGRDRADWGLMRSRDGGATWEATAFAGSPRAPVVAIAVGPGEHVAVATTDSTVLRSQDAGRTWHPLLERGRPAAGAR